MKSVNDPTYGVLDLIWNIRDSQLAGLTASAKLVLIVLASRAKKDLGYSCFPSVGELAADCQSSEDTINRALKLLVENNLIAKKRRFNTSSRYYVNFHLINHIALEQESMRRAEEGDESPFEPIVLDETSHYSRDETSPASGQREPTSQSSTRPSEFQLLKHVGKRLSTADCRGLSDWLRTTYGIENGKWTKWVLSLLDEKTLAKASSPDISRPSGFLRNAMANVIKDHIEANARKAVENTLRSQNSELIRLDEDTPRLLLDLYVSLWKSIGEDAVEVCLQNPNSYDDDRRLCLWSFYAPHAQNFSLQ